MVIDVGKGVLPVLVLPQLEIPGIGIDTQVSREFIIFAVGFGAILGHVYPLWHDFCGGKGGATAAGVICVVDPEVAFLVIRVWFVVVLVTRYVGLATMSAAVVIPVCIAFMTLPNGLDLLVFTALLAAFFVFTHRSNIQRILSGDEDRDMQSSWLGRRR